MKRVLILAAVCLLLLGGGRSFKSGSPKNENPNWRHFVYLDDASVTTTTDCIVQFNKDAGAGGCGNTGTFIPIPTNNTLQVTAFSVHAAEALGTNEQCDVNLNYGTNVDHATITGVLATVTTGTGNTVVAVGDSGGVSGINTDLVGGSWMNVSFEDNASCVGVEAIHVDILGVIR